MNQKDEGIKIVVGPELDPLGFGVIKENEGFGCSKENLSYFVFG